jgi:hypothetical protein
MNTFLTKSNYYPKNHKTSNLIKNEVKTISTQLKLKKYLTGGQGPDLGENGGRRMARDGDGMAAVNGGSVMNDGGEWWLGDEQRLRTTTGGGEWRRRWCTAVVNGPVVNGRVRES